MRGGLIGLSLLLLVNALTARAEDSTRLAESRREALHKASFYCPIGREPIASSLEALNVRPNAACKFNGPLDTKIETANLQPPLLNPRLTLESLKAFLLQRELVIVSDQPSSLQFKIASGEIFTASYVNYKSMKDPLLHLKGYPPEWGDQFVTISSHNPSDLYEVVALGQEHPESPLFWSNPHYQEEVSVRRRLDSPKPYLPLPLVSRCTDTDFSSAVPSLLIVGDLHNPPQSSYFLDLLKKQKFAWVGLEFDRAEYPLYEQFVNAPNAGEEERVLTVLLAQFPKNIQENFKNIFRYLKANKIEVVFVNSADRYFNFPYTNIGFHGLIMATRNQIWANALPSSWSGAAVLFAGLDHFTNYPGSDFQDFARERYPGLPMSLINPLETCVNR